jgi:hypothetical protein
METDSFPPSGDATPTCSSEDGLTAAEYVTNLVRDTAGLSRVLNLSGSKALTGGQRRHIADMFATLFEVAHNANIALWGSALYEEMLNTLVVGEDRPIDSDAFDMELDSPSTSKGKGKAPSSSLPQPPRRAPVGAHPLPRPPTRGGKGGAVRPGGFKSAMCGPLPPINFSTRPAATGKATYASTARFPGGLPQASVDGIVRLAKVFPELPTKQLQTMQAAAGPKKRSKSTPTVHGPSRRQVFVSVQAEDGQPVTSLPLTTTIYRGKNLSLLARCLSRHLQLVYM